MDVSRMYYHLNQLTERVDYDRALSSFDFLAPIDPPRFAGADRLDALGVDDSVAWARGLAVFFDATR